MPPPPTDPDALPARGRVVDLGRLQRRIDELYGERDRARGLDGTFVWFVEEVGELARALKGHDPGNLRTEFSDVLAWLATLANLARIDLADAAGRYLSGCPRCGESPCRCPPRSVQRAMEA